MQQIEEYKQSYQNLLKKYPKMKANFLMAKIKFLSYLLKIVEV